jgi:methylated-DNA-protein-cysteine methyltransferase-like protein
MDSNKDRIIKLIQTIPQGKIMSYGEVGGMVDVNPRIVGFILSGFNEEETKNYPWHRVVNRDGFISSSKLGSRGQLQESMLKAEGVEVENFQIIKPERYWFGRKSMDKEVIF